MPNDIRSLTDASDPLDHALPAESAFEIKSTGLYGGETPKNITYIVNKAGLEGPGNFSVTLRYKRVTAKASYGVQVPLKATIVEYRGTAEEVTSYSNTITLETRTFVRISADSFMKRIESTGYPDRVPYGMRSWPAEALYGPEPETNGVEYFYVWWNLITYEHGNDVGYYYAITETPGSGGEIVAIRSTYNTPEGYYPRMNTAQFNETFNQANQKINKRWPAAVLMRYPYSMLTVNGTESSATLTNSFTATLYRSDDTLIETRTASDSGTIRFTEDAYGGDSLEVGKSFSSHSSYENYGKGAASILMAGEDYGIKEEVNIPSAMTLFAKEQTKDAQGNYGQVAYTAALEDSTLHLVAGANSHLLQPGEYSIRKARFYVSHYVPSTAPHEPVQGTLEDELVDYTTNGPVLEFSPDGTNWVAATMTSQSIKQYTFPQGTVALRGSYSSKAAGVRLNLQIEQLELHSTPEVRAFLENNQTSRIDLQNTTAFPTDPADIEQAFAGAVSTDAALSANRFNFSGTQVNLSPALESGESGARLRVKAAEDAIFSTDTSVLQDGTYQYRMQRLSDRTDIFINNIFLLNLEVVPGTHWQGTLESVDVSENIAENVDAKVYYATEVQSETALPDFTNTAVWETRPEGADLSDVKAVGVDLTKDMDGNPFALHGLGRSLTVYYNMKAPDNVLPYFELSNDPVAKSQGVFYYNNPIDVVLDPADAPQMRAEPPYSYGHSVITTVHFFKMPLTISKTTQFGSGSAQTPINVWPDQALNYTLVVKNESETPQDAKEIVLIDTLPDHLALDAQQDIQFYFGSETPAAIDPGAVQRVQLAQDRQKFTFTIDSLSQNETLTLIIPTIVTPDPQQTSRYIFNSALIETVQGEPQYIESNMTYHRLGGPVTLSINAKKLLNNAAPPAEQFTFVLEGADGQDSAANNAQGMVVFEKTFDKPGEHTFTLSEKNDAQEGVTYDDTVYEVYVMLYAFPGMQQMQYGAMIMKDGEPIEGEMVFANTKPVDPLPRPTPAPMTSFVISAQKVLQGKTLAAGEFTFELRDSQGNVIDTAKNAADGRVSFGARRTGNAGTYLYTIAEVKGQDAGITYDAGVWQVRAVVKEAGGKLTASLSYLKDGTPYETATFTNSYLLPATGDAAPATIAALLALSVLLWMYSRKRKAEV